MSRKNTRHLALKLVFQADFSSRNSQTARELLPASLDEDYLTLLVEGTTRHRDTIDAIINRFSQGWSTTRMPRVDRTILRLAVFELLGTDTPPPVVINEAVELAKQYCDQPSPAFINGVLDSIRAQRDQLVLTDR